jgi:photosystem II stability/assembly factor-like uncharacterized protein
VGPSVSHGSRTTADGLRLESRNAGAKWRPISLPGDVDFHALEAQGRIVYGFGSDWDTREARFLRSDDGGRTWTRLTPPEGLLGLAIDPQDSRVSVALGEQRAWVASDGGASWRPLPIPGGVVTWTRELGLIAVDLDGVVRSASDPTGEWDEVGRLPGAPAALEGVGTNWSPPPTVRKSSRRATAARRGASF